MVKRSAGMMQLETGTFKRAGLNLINASQLAGSAAPAKARKSSVAVLVASMEIHDTTPGRLDSYF